MSVLMYEEFQKNCMQQKKNVAKIANTWHVVKRPENNQGGMA